MATSGGVWVAVRDKFFQNKEDLYKTLVREQCDRFHNELARAMEHPGDEIVRLRSCIRTKGELFRDNLPFLRIYVAETGGASYNIKVGPNEEVRAGYYYFLERLASVFDSGIKNKLFKRIASPYLLAVALDSTINSLLLLGLDMPAHHLEDPCVMLDVFFSGLAER